MEAVQTYIYTLNICHVKQAFGICKAKVINTHLLNWGIATVLQAACSTFCACEHAGQFTEGHACGIDALQDFITHTSRIVCAATCSRTTSCGGVAAVASMIPFSAVVAPETSPKHQQLMSNLKRTERL